MGNTDDIAGRIDALRDAGVEEVSFLLGVDAVPAIETIAKDIMPRFSETPD